MTITAATANGTASATSAAPTERKHGLAKLRRTETRQLASLASDAMSETWDLGHDLHKVIYAPDEEFRPENAACLIEEALACWQTADHYLRMLADTLADYDPQAGNPPHL
jgi:hypothetical protein